MEQLDLDKSSSPVKLTLFYKFQIAFPALEGIISNPLILKCTRSVNTIYLFKTSLNIV